ncbi:MBL fold metallo-hydrolase [Candidatus Accumulibacter sp. ACC005]|uniref:MBL fold metallo-hydrolase n=1 Tax=Candidatus Accumulibacter sp. ACC005 TaxID=2823331 RepID=UPI0025BBDCB7|nr:MBL fold metallo-hydrolase [Candidatus Accumulibacter sp. ACC005]
MLVDDDILVDAGTGVADLSRSQLACIDHVFLTHSHLDHIASLPLLIDSVSDLRAKPLIVYATARHRTSLAKAIFNWAIFGLMSVFISESRHR